MYPAAGITNILPTLFNTLRLVTAPTLTLQQF
jgi:hypothetical protein